METVIKYENCEEMYPEMAAGPESSINVDGTANQYVDSGGDVDVSAALKRSYIEVNNGPLAVGTECYYAAGNNCQMSAQNQEHYRGFYASAAYQQQQLQSSGPIAFKRYRKNTDYVPTIFRAPFFELQQEDECKPGVVTARCRSCNVELRGHKNVSSNFIKHMKRGHPEIHKIYENIKLLRRGPFKDHQAADIEQAYLDASTLLEHLNATPASYDEERHSETTDHSTTTPPNHTEASEPLDSSAEAQQRLAAAEKRATASSTKESLKVDLSNQTLEIMSRMLDAKLKNFVSKTEFNETTKALTDLVENNSEEQTATSAANSNKGSDATTTALQSQLSDLQQECREMRTAMQHAQQSKRQLQCEVQAMHRTLHGHKIIVHNMEVKESQQPQAAVQQLLRERLELPDINLRCVTVLNIKNKKHSLRIELINVNDAKKIFQNCHKLKNTGIYVEPELSLWARKRKAKLLVLRKELLRRKSDLKVCVRNTILMVADKRFFWDEVEGLCVEHVEDNTVLSGPAYLKALTGLDLSEFLNVLTHYDVQMR